MTITLGASDYLAIFSTSHNTGSITSNQGIFYSFFVDCSPVTATERQAKVDESIDNADIAAMMTGKVSPGVGDAVEVR